MQADASLDAGKSGCGELVMLVFQKMRPLAPGQTLLVIAYDEAAEVDLAAWCRSTGNLLLKQDTSNQRKSFWIQKGS
jgi:tRNA 2-thiouridine synthesizing protein A